MLWNLSNQFRCETRHSERPYTVTVSGRIGVFGGTFDPPHIGHLIVALHARHALGLDEVLLVVANRPWQKEGERQVTPAHHRLAMVDLAIGNVQGLRASDVELRRGGVSYTVDTVRELEEAGAAEVVLIMGRDAASGLPTWDRVEELRDRVTVAVVDRPGAHGAPPPGWHTVEVEAPWLEVSSTDLRARFVDGRPLDYLTPDAVISYAERHRLYVDRPMA
jgi:nicotinate-nucleotide adenylyltransferase